MESGGEAYHFQVNLGGMLDILSNHLYQSADVFLRELLQNGVDAIKLREKKEPGGIKDVYIFAFNLEEGWFLRIMEQVLPRRKYIVFCQ